MTEVNILFAEDHGAGIKVTNSLWEKWKLSYEKEYSIQFGERSIDCIIEPVEGEGEKLFLSKSIEHQLSVPFPKQAQATIDDSKIRIGPLIGLLVNRLTPRSKGLRFFNKMISLTSHTANYAFIFTPQDFDWSSKTIMGTFLKDNIHYRKRIPFPDVIYTRIGRKLERTNQVQTMYSNLKLQSTVEIFNPHYFNKETIHKIMEAHSEAKTHLPSTIFSPTTTDVETLLNQYRTIFLKPKNRAGGRGIYRVTKLKNHYIYNTEKTILKYKTLTGVLKKIQLSKSKKKYLAQQGINLIKYKGRKVDFRVNVNKDLENNWVITGMAGKAAGKKSVTTHNRLGGKTYSSDLVLAYVFKDKSADITRKIEEAVIKLACVIASSHDVNIGELGFDIGVDTEGNVWIFEVNSRPGRSIFSHPNLKEANLKSINLLYEYAYYLAGFVKK